MSRRNWINLFSTSQSVELSVILSAAMRRLCSSKAWNWSITATGRSGRISSSPCRVLFRQRFCVVSNGIGHLPQQRRASRTNGANCSQELRQLQLIESVVSRYGSRRSSSSPSISRSPAALPVHFLVSSTAFGFSWIPQPKIVSLPAIGAVVTAR